MEYDLARLIDALAYMTIVKLFDGYNYRFL